MAKNEISQSIKSQLLASLYMLKDCITRCSINDWHERHNDYPFSRVVFHALFDCDLNLSENETTLREQKFHIENRSSFGEYEELDGRIAEKEYEKAFIEKYYQHCISIVFVVFSLVNDNELIIPNTDYYKSMTRLERYINCIRHTQHHAAQLGLRLQFITGKEMEWIGRIKE